LSTINPLELSLKWKVPEVSKRTTTIHADFHDYNFLYSDHKENLLRVIDLDTSWVGNPLTDLSRNMWTMNLNFSQRQVLVKSYLEHLGLKNVNKQKVYDMLYDSEVYKLFTYVEGFIFGLFQKCQADQAKDSNFIHNQLSDLINIWTEAGKSKKSQMRLVKDGIFLYAHETNKKWHKWATTSTCGLSMYMIQPGFRKDEKFTNSLELFGHGSAIKMTEVKTFLSHFNDMFKPEYVSTTQAVEPWTDYYKEGGIKIIPKSNAEVITYFGPVEGEKGRRFVVGTARKSGYPYGIMTGWMNIVANEKDKKAHVVFKTTKWHAMGLGIPDPHALAKKMMTDIENSITHVWNANMKHPTDLVKPTLAKKAPVAKKAKAAKKAPAAKKAKAAKKAPAHKKRRLLKK